MRRALLATTVVAACAATVPASAQAEYFFSQRGAQTVTRDFLWKKYDMNRYNTIAVCRPQGEAAADSRYKYHRWVCEWGEGGGSRHTVFCRDGYWLTGRVLVVGISGRGRYGTRVIQGGRCRPLPE